MTTDDQVDDRILAVIEPRWAGHHTEHASHDKLHALEHAHEQELSRHAEKRLEERNDAHTREHIADDEAINKALAEVDKLAVLHATAHAREHLAHEQRHEDARIAVIKGENAMDKRLETLNGVYSQMREQSKTFASNERMDTIYSEINRRFTDTTRHTDEKYEENRRRIEAIEKGDVKAEGKSLGQGAVVAIIVGAISLVGTVLGILIIVSNLVTGA